MVFCCGEIEALTPEQGVGSTKGSLYPGQRRPVQNGVTTPGEDLVSGKFCRAR